jgi:glucose/arabinose dehydrogenase
MKIPCVALLLALAAPESIAAEGTNLIPHRQDQPPNQPYTADEALKRFTVPEGFRVELVASEPDIVNPVAMTFDDRGRIWITESVEYPRKPAGVGRDRVKILEDLDRDGRAEKVTVFADGLNIPTGVALGYGGVWLLNAPDLLFLREKDGKEVSREVVVTGFGRTDTHELPNSLTWGPDGWLYGLNGVFNRCSVLSNNGKRYDFTCALWRVHPRTREFQVVAEGTSNPYGLGWDPEGSAIIEVCPSPITVTKRLLIADLRSSTPTPFPRSTAGTLPSATSTAAASTSIGSSATARRIAQRPYRIC